MRDKLCMLVSALSLLLCIAACGAWIAARVPGGAAVGRVGAVGDGVALCMNRDDVALVRETNLAIPAGGTLLTPATPVGPGVVRVSIAGAMPVPPVPYWMIAACGAVMPIAWAWRTRAATRRKRCLRGLCMVCGYDLRATRDRCPECGAAAPANF